MTLEGYILSTIPTSIIERLMMPTLIDVMVTILGCVVVLATILIIQLLRWH